MLALPEASFAVGVKSAVRVTPLPLKAPSVPPVVTISVPTKLVPGSSLNVKVIVDVSPPFNELAPLVSVTVGTSVSIETDGVLPALPGLPAVSV